MSAFFSDLYFLCCCAQYMIFYDLKTSHFIEALFRYFAIFEYISLTLGFIPSKELLSISLLLKTDRLVA